MNMIFKHLKSLFSRVNREKTIVVTGDEGIGKTSSIFDCLNSLVNRDEIIEIDAKDREEIMKLINGEIENIAHKTIFINNISEIAEDLRDKIEELINKRTQIPISTMIIVELSKKVQKWKPRILDTVNIELGRPNLFNLQDRIEFLNFNIRHKNALLTTAFLMAMPRLVDGTLDRQSNFKNWTKAGTELEINNLAKYSYENGLTMSSDMKAINAVLDQNKITDPERALFKNFINHLKYMPTPQNIVENGGMAFDKNVLTYSDFVNTPANPQYYNPYQQAVTVATINKFENLYKEIPNQQPTQKNKTLDAVGAIITGILNFYQNNLNNQASQLAMSFFVGNVMNNNISFLSSQDGKNILETMSGAMSEVLNNNKTSFDNLMGMGLNIKPV